MILINRGECPLANFNAVEEVIPSAKRLINSLRSLGYEFPTAIAELVDNSIEAKATVVFIDVEFDGENSWVMIADNGRGMTAEKLKEAMRYGSDSEYDENSLGKFGLGLKTASFGQAKHWVVATRTGSSENEISAFKWDIDHVNRTNRWEILSIKEKKLDPIILESLKNKTGTAVLWKQLEIVNGYENPNTERARKKLVNMCRDVEEHLAMVFHRFLMGEVARKKLKIFLNGNEIQPWDPYARSEKATKVLDVIKIPVEHEGSHGEVIIEPYILPPSKMFSSTNAHTKAAGPKKWNQQQGFYIYRNNRMIQSGGWCRIRTYDEHTKLARFAVNFSSKIDGAFKIDVSKMYVQLPPQIRKEIEEQIQSRVIKAREIYDNAEKESPRDLSSDSNPEYNRRQQNAGIPYQNSTGSSTEPTRQVISDSARVADPPATSPHAGTTSRPYIIFEEPCIPAEKTWTLDQIFDALKKDAKATEIRVLEKLFNRLREELQKNDVEI